MRPSLKTVASWTLTLGCAGFIVHLFATEQANLGLLSRISLHDIVVITLLQAGQLLLNAFRYLLIVEKCSGQSIAFIPWLRVYVFARLVNLILPQAGNVYRALRLKKLFQVSYTRYAGSFLAFGWIGASLNLAIAAAAVALWAPELQFGTVSAHWWLLMLALGFACGPLVLDQAVRRIPAQGRLLRMRASAGEAVGSAVLAVTDLGHFGWAVGLGLSAFTLACLVFYVSFLSLGIELGAGELALFYAVLQLSTYVQLTPGNLAVQEIAFGLMGEHIGIGMGEGIVVAALLRLCGYAALALLAAPMGILNLFRQMRGARS